MVEFPSPKNNYDLVVSKNLIMAEFKFSILL